MDNLFKADRSEKEERSRILKTKNNMLNSLQEVENFLINGKKAIKGVKLYKILKK